MPLKPSPYPEARLDPEQSLQKTLDWKEVFGNGHSVEVEIGIGKGRFLLAAAEAHPKRNFLGVEWSNEYLRIGEERAAKRGLKNIRFLRVDAKELLHASVPSASVSAYYIFYPDPWPKKKQHKRRFFDRRALDQIARTLKPGGKVHVASDHEAYWEVIAELFRGDERFSLCPEFGGEGFPLPTDGPLTNYEAKFHLVGKKCQRASWLLREEAGG